MTTVLIETTASVRVSRYSKRWKEGEKKQEKNSLIMIIMITNPQSTTNIHIHHFDWKNPPTPGGFPITMFPYQELWVRGPPSKSLYQVLRGGSSCHVSWWGQILNRKPPLEGGGFPSINFILFPHNNFSKRIITLNDERRGGKNKRKKWIKNNNKKFKPSVHYKHTHKPLDTLPS